VNSVGELQKQGVQLKSLADAIDTGTPSGRFLPRQGYPIAQIVLAIRYSTGSS
jgi:DNA invertase Pin-like site-specific DNA recombinase